MSERINDVGILALKKFWKEVEESHASPISEEGTTEMLLGDVPSLVLKGETAKSHLEGTKHDSGKSDLALVPSIAIEGIARALMFGEKKYGRYNYTNGFETSRLISACQRHIAAYLDGEDLDRESGLPHLYHAQACLAMLVHCEQLGTLRDNRLKRSK